MTPNPYNMSQWNWIADRVEEGYKVSEIADFIGMHNQNVYENLCSIGRRLRPEERIPLNERKKEFNSLANDGSPSIDNYYVPVVGVDAAGNRVRFHSTREAERSLGIPYDQIGNAIRRGYRCHGYRWRMEDER
jgi:hypothetical protein